MITLEELQKKHEQENKNFFNRVEFVEKRLNELTEELEGPKFFSQRHPADLLTKREQTNKEATKKEYEDLVVERHTLQKEKESFLAVMISLKLNNGLNENQYQERANLISRIAELDKAKEFHEKVQDLVKNAGMSEQTAMHFIQQQQEKAE